LTYSAATMESVRSLVERLIEMTHFYRRANHNIVHASEGRTWILEYDHRLIYDALERRDGREAAILMRLHTRRARLALKAHPEVFRSKDDRAVRPARLDV
jgi:DNA-binding GntR family transcriptional regulator